MKTYRSILESGTFKVWVIPGDGNDGYWLPPRPELIGAVKSPGFCWGVADARTRHLAAAMLADLTGRVDESTLAPILAGWIRFLSCLPDDGFEMNDSFLIALIYALSPQPQRQPMLGQLRNLFGHSADSSAPDHSPPAPTH